MSQNERNRTRPSAGDRLMTIGAGAFLFGFVSWYFGASWSIDRALDTAAGRSGPRARGYARTIDQTLYAALCGGCSVRSSITSKPARR